MTPEAAKRSTRFRELGARQGLPCLNGGDRKAEGISAVRAVTANQLTRAINLSLGAAASTLGLTVPAVLLIGLFTGQPFTLGLSPANMVLLVMTLLMSIVTSSGSRTTILEGAVHNSIFGVFMVLVFSP